jgi:hypothetical protein
MENSFPLPKPLMKRIQISLSSYRVYVAAVRLLTRRLGVRSPSAVALIRHELAHRCARLIADDYFDGMARQPSGNLGRRRAHSALPAMRGKNLRGRLPVPRDPSRN